MNIYIYGSGGHGRVVCDSAISGYMNIKGFIDDDKKKSDSLINGIKVVSYDDYKALPNTAAVVAIGDNKARKRIHETLNSNDVRLIAVIDRSAVISPSAIIGFGCQILPRVVVNNNALLGDGVIVNTGAVIEHDCKIGDFCHIAPGSVLLGGCHVGEGTLVGAGAIIQQSVNVGKNVTIGTGAVVTEDIKDGQTVVGIPAKSI